MLGKKHVADVFFDLGWLGGAQFKTTSIFLLYTCVHGMDAAARFCRSSLNWQSVVCLFVFSLWGALMNSSFLLLQGRVFFFFPKNCNTEWINLGLSSSDCWHSSSVSSSEVTQISIRLKALRGVLLSHSQKENSTVISAIQCWWRKEMLCLRSNICI